MSFMDEVKAAKPKPVPEKTEMDLAMECSEKIKKEIMSEARRSQGQCKFAAVYVMSINPLQSRNVKIVMRKNKLLSDKMAEEKVEYIVPKSAIQFHDNLKSILAKDGIIVGDWEYELLQKWRVSDYFRIYEHKEGIIYRNRDDNSYEFELLKGTEFNPNIPLESHCKGKIFLSVTLHQKDKILTDNIDSEQAILPNIKIGFRITFSE